jgi:hypothetical protein
MRAGFAMEKTRAGGDASQNRAGAQRARDETLDWVKGVLVIVMVIYHSMNIFTKAGPSEYVYIRFVSGSFVLISGYIVARFYGDAWVARNSSRLVVRGVKLVVVFTILNLIINFTGAGNPTKPHYDMWGFLSSLYDIYVAGAPRRASFQILLPIGYLLISAPLFLTLQAYARLVALATIVMMGVYSLSSSESVNFEFLSLGLLGLNGGLAFRAWGASWSEFRNTRAAWGALAAVILAMKFLSANLVSLTLGMVLLLKFLYDIGKAVSNAPRVSPALILLGQYSLVSYIAQILFLHAFSRAIGRPQWALGYEIVIPVVSATLFLLVFSNMLRLLEARSRVFSRAYGLVFR